MRPKMTPSIRNALADLGLAKVAVVYPGDRRYPLADKVEAVPVSELAAPGRLFANRRSLMGTTPRPAPSSLTRL